MKNRSPIYELIHREMRTCANRLLEMGQDEEFLEEKDSQEALCRLAELHQFAGRVRSDDYYYSLFALKEYLENTMLQYQDGHNRTFTMRLSETLSLLGLPAEADTPQFNQDTVRSLTQYFAAHFKKEIQPGQPLFQKLVEIKKI